MSLPAQFALALKALREVQAELGETPASETAEMFAGLERAVQGIASVPEGSLLFGIASDSLPLLLDLNNPASGAVLVTADRGSGKTAFLQMVLMAASRLLPPEKVQFAVLTDYPGDWDDIDEPDSLLGVWPAYEPAAFSMLADLAQWVKDGGDGRSIILLWDGLDAALHLPPEAQETLRFLVSNGPAAGLWPLVTSNAIRAVRMPEWLELFRTRIYGRIADPRVGDELTPIPGAGLNTLLPGSQFCLRERGRWLRFWMPQF